MNEKIKIDIVSDVVCPWCIIGYKRLEKAISEMKIADKVEIEWQAFELNPQMPMEGEDIDEHIQRKYGSSPEENIRSQVNLAKLGEELDFKFNFFDGMRMPNTRDAHILIDYARENGKQTELNMRLIEAHFSEGKDVSKHEILIEEVKTIGLNAKEAMSRLTNEAARKAVAEKESYWHRRGVNSVPTMVFNNTSGITGAQSVDVYKKVLADLMK